MKDKKLLMIALIWSLIGIIILISIASFTKPETIKILFIEDNLGKVVVIEGKITSAIYKENVAFLRIKDESSSTTVVIFDKVENKIYKDENVKVTGKVEIYKGELEIIAQSIERI